MNADLAALLYLVAGVLFILALRGLSSPVTSRRGNTFGMIGMAIAIGTTLAAHPPASTAAWVLVIARHRDRRRHRRDHRAPCADDVDAGTGRGLPLAGRHGGGPGGGRRALRARRVRHRHRRQHPRASLVEMSLGVAIGAITFTGSIIAFLKLSARMSGAPILLPVRHVINIAPGDRDRAADCLVRPQRELCRVLAARFLVLRLRRADHRSDRRRRHAGRDLDAQLLFGVGGSRHRLHARQFRADHYRRAGRLLGRDPVLHHVQGDEPQLRLGHPRRLRRRGCGSGRRQGDSAR